MLLAGILALCAVGFYLPALRGALVWDDHMIVSGEAIGGGRSAAACFTQPFLFFYYRPLVSLSFWLDLRLWGASPVHMHMVNLLLHAGSVVGVVALGRRILCDRWAALLAGALFGVHPVMGGSVAWIGGRTDTLSIFFVVWCLVGLVAAARSVGDSRSLWLALSVASFTLAVFTKEQTAAILLLVPLAFLCFRPTRGVSLPGGHWFAMLPYGVVVVFFVAMGVFVSLPRPALLPAPPMEQATRAGQSILAYALMLVAPWPRLMSAVTLAPFEHLGAWPALVGFGLAVAWVAGVAVAWRRRRETAWLLLLCGLALGPVVNLVPLPFLLLAPYRASLACVAVALMAAGLVTGASRRWGGAPAAALAACALLGWGGVAVAGMGVWASEPQLYRSMLRWDPACGVARYNLARNAMLQQRWSEALPHLGVLLDSLVGAGQWEPDRIAAVAGRPEVRRRLQQGQGSAGRPEEYLALLLGQVGAAHSGLSDIAGAERAFLAADAVKPRSAETLGWLGYCAAQRGDTAEAERRYLRAIQADTGSAGPRRGLSVIYFGQGRYAEARRFTQEAEACPRP
jgi:hypothetical protein